MRDVLFLYRFFAVKNLHLSKLLIGNLQDAHFAKFGQALFYPPFMHIGIFGTAAMAHLGTELEHAKAIL